MARVVEGINGLKELVGEHLGYSDWIDIDQGRSLTPRAITSGSTSIPNEPPRKALLAVRSRTDT